MGKSFVHRHLQQIFSPGSINNLILCHLSPRTLVRLSRTCHYMYVAVTCFLQRAYNINRHLSRYFPDPLAFRSLQARTGLVISGSNAIQFMDRTYYPESDLELYAHPGHARELSEWLVSAGYIFEPTQHQHKDWYENIPADWDGTTKWVPEDQADGLHQPAIAAILFKRFVVMDGEPVELKVQVVETTCNPIETIMKSHSTCVMNVITFDAAYSFYPIATFEERSTLRIPASGPCPDALATCVRKGWRIYAVFRPWDIARPSASPFFLNETRWVGDSRCWSISLDTSGVQPRPVLSPSSERFSWDPSLHNGWIMSYKDTEVPGQKVPIINAHPVMSTIFRYNYIFPDEAPAWAIRAWSTRQGKLYHRIQTKQDWTWFDADIPGFRKAQNQPKLAGVV